MRAVDLRTPAPAGGDRQRLARLTRHLKARLEDFGPGGPQVLLFDQDQGLVSARIPGRQVQALLALLADRGVLADREGDALLFRLRPQLRFEDLDHVWGLLYGV